MSKKTYDWAPLATSPRGYYEKKMGRTMTVTDAKSDDALKMMEAFEAGQDSQIDALLPLFKTTLKHLPKTASKDLRVMLESLIAQGERKRAGEVERTFDGGPTEWEVRLRESLPKNPEPDLAPVELKEAFSQLLMTIKVLRGKVVDSHEEINTQGAFYHEGCYTVHRETGEVTLKKGACTNCSTQFQEKT